MAERRIVRINVAVADKVPDVEMVLYRYRDLQIDGFGWDTRPVVAVKSMELILEKYQIIKFTPCGCWIAIGGDWKKFVNLNANRKWAHPDKENAMRSFLARKKRQVSILKNQLICAEAALLLNAEDACEFHQGMYRLEP